MIEFPKNLILRNIGGADQALAVSIQDEMNRAVARKMNLNMGFAAVLTGSATTSSAIAPTFAEIEKAMAEFNAFHARVAPRAFEMDLGELLGVRVHIISEAMLPRDPRRVHKRQRWDRSGKYHLRIQKKWDKRFGVDVRQVAYASDAGKTLYMTLAMLERIKTEVA